MKVSFKVKKEYDIKYLQLKVNIRYFEDAILYKNISINSEQGGKKDTLHEMPCTDGTIWFPKINVDTGEVVNWKKGIKAKIHYKVCDEGTYEFLDQNNNIIYSYEGYVPSVLSIDDVGYGDYIYITINETGFIEKWTACCLNDCINDNINDD
jgi:hypothetical protein